MTVPLAASAIVWAGRSGREAADMLWDTLWALALGFALSGAVQAFVSKAALERSMGTRRPAALARSAGYGMASSSCSYAAAAMAKSLFAKGADFVDALVFMVASTNLVLELGVVLVVLLGWQFAAAEFVGGAIMIVLLAVVGGWVFNERLVSRTRAHVTAPSTGDEIAPASGAWRTRAGWADAAGFALADLKMLRRELVIGFVVAGMLAVLVPNHVWNAVFIHGHGTWTSVENVLVGPLIALISFVCSIGNVPLAAALWQGGISFGGVVAFVFADLISLPLLMVYRRYYGTAMAVRMLVVLWATMAVAGLAVEALTSGVGLLPTHRPVRVAAGSFGWNYTSVLDVVALLGVAGLFWLRRYRSGIFVVDPVCGMQVATASALSATVHGTTVWFCSDGCADRYRERSEATS